MSVTKRIEQLLEEYKLSPSRFADEIDVQRSSISHILSERNKPSLELISKILKKYPEINADWLITGKGKMQLDLFGEKASVPETPIQNTVKNNFQPRVEQVEIQEPEIEKSKTFEFEKPIASHFSFLPEEKKIVSNSEESLEPKKELEFVTPTHSKVENIEQISKVPVTEEKIIPSKINESKKVKKIVFFYEDNTFEIFNP
jgi:transcriptional regulator with XRE-family HTH domain